MNQFFARHRSFVFSVLFLLTGLAGLGYSTSWRPKMEAAKALSSFYATLNQETLALRRQESLQPKPSADVKVEGIRSLPQFLTRINDIARETKVIVRELSPSKEGEIKFVIKIRTNYDTFLRFAARLETLDVLINDVQVRPYNPDPKNPEQTIEFSITPRGSVEPLKDDRIQLMRVAVESPEKRNPFQRFAFDTSKGVATQELDLTWQYKLSGIGRVGEQRVATIDNKDYREKDGLDGMEIYKIDPDRVFLSRKSQDRTDKFVLKFRATGLKPAK